MINNLHKRTFEDKDDTFSPFVPLDPDNIVEICEQNTNRTSNIKIVNNNMFIYGLLLIIIILSLKRYMRK